MCDFSTEQELYSSEMSLWEDEVPPSFILILVKLNILQKIVDKISYRIVKYTYFGDVAEWQTRLVEGQVSLSSCEFDSHRPHQRPHFELRLPLV